uniref:Uncharacterized protein n=1 Tax=Timspurckia oligopyrenoides TaxID=708627 RepID=A0A7S1EUA8_9RHOD|mmetsp:Transcript_7807/g.14182  ORF Transcript_7807/g.14182 Transcript_7807/m.14182 type:complete len:286 (+) Transcript_7807:141-998(+)
MRVIDVLVGLSLICLVFNVFGQTCDCNSVTSTVCPTIQVASVDGDGTLRCVSGTVPSCESFFCELNGPAICTISNPETLVFTGVEDICIRQAVQVVIPADFTTLLGPNNFQTGAPSQHPSLSNQGLNDGVSGTVYYIRFTTGTDLTTSQILFEDGNARSGTAVQLVGGNFNLYVGDGLKETISGGIFPNTFYSMILFARPATAAGANDGEYTFWIGENIDLLGVSLADVSPVADVSTLSATSLGGNSQLGVGRAAANAINNIAGDFLGTFDAGNDVFQVWSDTAL